MLILDSLEGNTLYYSIDEDKYSDDLNSFQTATEVVQGDFVSLQLYMRDFYSEVSAVICDTIRDEEVEVVGYVSREDRGVLKLYLDFNFEENKSYDLEVFSELGDLLYRGNIITGNDYLDTETNGIIKY